MSACEEYEGLIAQSLYETLNEDEETRLSAHLTECTGCKAESASLSVFKEFIPVETVEFQGNLRPVLEERVRTSRGRSWVPRLVFSGLCGAFVVALLSVQFGSTPTKPTEQLRAHAGHTPAERYFGATMIRVDRFVDEEKYPQAYVILRESIDSAMEGMVPPKARVLLAEIAYERLQWYPEAFSAYDELRMVEPEIFRESDTAIQRHAVLDEARLVDSEYASLHGWNTVVREENVESLSGYIAKYPGTFQASEAVQEMARLIARDTEEGDTGLGTVLDVALALNDNPVVVAQIKLELGRYYWQNTDDTNKARALFKEVEDSSVTVLALAASDSLRALEGE